MHISKDVNIVSIEIIVFLVIKAAQTVREKLLFQREIKYWEWKKKQKSLLLVDCETRTAAHDI